MQKNYPIIIVAIALFVLSMLFIVSDTNLVKAQYVVIVENKDIDNIITGTMGCQKPDDLLFKVREPDPNESLEILHLYADGQILLRLSSVDEAVTFFKKAVMYYPESRHLHAGLGESYWQQYETTQNLDDLRIAVQEYRRAAEIGMHYGRVRYTLRIGTGLGILGNVHDIDTFFQNALVVAAHNPHLTQLHYAVALAIVNDVDAEIWFNQAIQTRPVGTISAVALYTEWLIQQHRLEDALRIAQPEPYGDYYLHFLRGVALEQSGKLEDALKEYTMYREFNRHFYAPCFLQIEGSQLQTELNFYPTFHHLLSCDYADPICRLAGVIQAEASSEGRGGRRSVGWVIRNRVFLGNVGRDENGNVCMSTNNSGSTLVEKYNNVMYGAFADPDPNPDSESQQVAYDVYHGEVPEPYTGYCPNPVTHPAGGNCLGYCVRTIPGDPEPIVGGLVVGGATGGLIAHHAKDYDITCNATRPQFNYPPFSCSFYQGDICENSGEGEYGNCFYTAPFNVYLPLVLRMV